MNIQFARGNQFPLSFKIKDAQKVNLTDADVDEITITCRKEPNKNSDVLFQKKLSDGTIVYDLEIEKFVWWIKKEDTENLKYGDYGYDIEVIKGDIIATKVGSFQITDEYTM